MLVRLIRHLRARPRLRWRRHRAPGVLPEPSSTAPLARHIFATSSKLSGPVQARRPVLRESGRPNLRQDAEARASTPSPSRPDAFLRRPTRRKQTPEA